ncbi:MAG: hypothetical protein RLZZ401_60 [Pseudomonadota bacterium]
MRALDFNVLVRLLARDDDKQAQAADKFIAPGAWVSHLVLAEAMWVLESVYERTAGQLIAALERLTAHETLVLQDANVVRSALSQFHQKPKLGFSDCLVVEIARKAGHLPLGTFDKALSGVTGTQRL